MLRKIHLNKTAKFIALSIKIGAILARAQEKIKNKLHQAGLYLGMLFQYTDDILDVIGEKNSLGKTPGKDLSAGKLTAPLIYGLDGAKFRAHRYATLAKMKFAELSDNFKIFGEIIDFVLNRTF